MLKTRYLPSLLACMLSILMMETVLLFAGPPALHAVESSGMKTASKGAPGTYLADSHQLHELCEFLAKAAENNNDLRAAYAKWQAAVQKTMRADTLPDPKFTFAYYTTPLETRGGPARYKYGLAQSFPFFGKLDQKQQIALKEADGIKTRLDTLKLSTYREVKSVYYEYAYLARAIELTRENIELMKYLERIATARYTTGSASHADIIRPQVELGKLEDRLNSLLALKGPLQSRLNALMDQPDGNTIDFPASIPVMELALADDELIEELRSNNPRLEFLQTVASKEKESLKLAELGYYPDFTVGIESTEVDHARNPGVIGDGQNPVMVSLSFNLPIWVDSRDSAVAESEARIRAAKFEKAGLLRKLTADLALAQYKYKDAGRKINLYRDTLVPKAEQALAVTMEAFMTGAGTALDLINAEKTLLELQLAYYRALADQAQRLAEIETIVGRELPCRFHGSLLKKTTNVQ